MLVSEARRDHDRSERGDTLIEVLIALTVVAITGLTLLTAFGTAIAASSQHKSLANIYTLLRSYAEVETFQIQLQPSPLYSSCATSYTLSNAPAIPTGYTITTSSIQYWNGTSFASTCTSGSTKPQLVTLHATGPNGQSGNLSFAVSNYAYTSISTSAPTFTSGASDTVLAGAAFTYTISASGTPAPTISESGALPSGVTFTNNGNGTATLAGTSSVAAGTYSFTLTASNSAGSPDTQVFLLNVDTTPVFTSSSSTSWSSKNATFTVSATSTPTPSLAVLSTLPIGVSFIDNGNGTGTLKNSNSSTPGVYSITFQANNGPFNATQSFTLTIT